VGRIVARIGDAFVEREQNSLGLKRRVDNDGIRLSAQALVLYCVRVVTQVSQVIRDLYG
jgi:hypothetical protein